MLPLKQSDSFGVFGFCVRLAFVGRQTAPPWLFISYPLHFSYWYDIFPNVMTLTLNLTWGCVCQSAIFNFQICLNMIFTLKRPYQRWNCTSYKDPYKLLPAYTAFIAQCSHSLHIYRGIFAYIRCRYGWSQGSTFCLMFSYLELTQDYVLQRVCYHL